MSQTNYSTAGTGTGTDSNDDNDRETRGLCLLSLDGGGVRGLSTLYILKAIMRRLNDERQALKLKQIKPCEIFDLIGGTSTGGLIAIMLGRLEMDVDKCIIAYKALMRTVFKKKEHVVPVSLNGTIKPRFSSKVLENVIKGVIEGVIKDRVDVPGQKPILVDEPFYLESQDEVSRRCRVFVCAQRVETGKITRLRSYPIMGEDPGEATIWQAALATSAATSFFDSVKIGDCTYGDGAMGANNPAREVQNEADKIWCETSGKLEPLVKCFISLGTGHEGINSISDKVWEFFSKSLVNVATDTIATAEEVATRWKHLQDTRYFRFNVQHGLQYAGLADCKEGKIGLMEAATRDYLDSQETSRRVCSCVTNLRTKEFDLDPPARKFCVEQGKLQAVQDRTKQQAPETMTKAEMSQLTVKANTYLKRSRATVTHEDLVKAHSIFDAILRAKQTQQPPATPKELAHIYNKLRSTCHRLSHFNFSPTQRMNYIDDAAKYGNRAVENAIASQNNDRVAQMQFYRACVQARKIQLKAEEEQRFQAPTPLERAAAEEAIMVAWATLRSIEDSDMKLFDIMKEESISQLRWLT